MKNENLKERCADIIIGLWTECDYSGLITPKELKEETEGVDVSEWIFKFSKFIYDPYTGEKINWNDIINYLNNEEIRKWISL